MHDRDRNETAGATGGADAGAGPSEARDRDLESLARDWITLWQSEIAALAHDREAAETVSRMAAIWAGLAASWLRAAPPSHEPAAAGPSAPGATPAAAAPDAGLAQIRALLGDLAERLGGIERRMAALEHPSPQEPGRAKRPGSRDRRRPGGTSGGVKQGGVKQGGPKRGR